MRTSLIYIDHIPIPWSAHGGYGRKSYDKKAKEKNEYRRQIKEQWGKKETISTPTALDIQYVMPIPKNTPKAKREQMLNGDIFHIARPDTTNLNKLAEDTLKEIVLSDDSIVVDIRGRKRYGTKPCIQIWIHELTQP